MKEPANMVEYAESVQEQSHTLMVMLCRELGPEHRATIKVLEMLTQAANIVQGTRMQQEQADGYDLKALVVNASVPSNSETGWERED